MQLSLSLLAILSLFGAAQGVLLALALLSVRRSRPVVNRILAAFVIAVSIFLFGAVLRTSNYVLLFPHLSRLHDPFSLLVGPLLFLYLKALTSRRPVFRRRDTLHFIPFALCVLYLLPYYLQSREAKLASLIAEYNQADMGQWYYVRSTVVITQFLIYLVLAIALMVDYSRRLKRQDSSLNPGALFQVRFLTGASLVLWILAALRFVLDHTAATNLVVPFGASVIVYALGYMGLRKPDALVGADEEPLAGVAEQGTKYERSRLTPERSERYLKKLVEAMETEKLYRDGELTLQKLSERLSIPAQHLSQTINGRLNQTFTEFVNAYRIEEAKRRLLDPTLKHYSVLAIAEDVGFNSKSSFNAVFKKHVHMTPSEFRKASNGNGAH
ncbi:MAG: AraC family transcriptional regulator [Pyrinomonadaceae bacterium]|nr:AraC family transcriptional regulator [Pyrinomonadaceae bacterium]